MGAGLQAEALAYEPDRRWAGDLERRLATIALVYGTVDGSGGAAAKPFHQQERACLLAAQGTGGRSAVNLRPGIGGGGRSAVRVAPASVINDATFATWMRCCYIEGKQMVTVGSALSIAQRQVADQRMWR